MKTFRTEVEILVPYKIVLEIEVDSTSRAKSVGLIKDHFDSGAYQADKTEISSIEIQKINDPFDGKEFESIHHYLISEAEDLNLRGKVLNCKELK